jgi:hypothetical protein
MQSPLYDATQPSPAVVPRQQGAHPSGSETTVSGKAAMAATPPLSLPEDVVTLSSPHDGSSPQKKASQPVSNEERQALLNVNPPGAGFSVYG